MDSETSNSSLSNHDKDSDAASSPSVVSEKDSSAVDSASMLSSSTISSWAKSIKLPQISQSNDTGKFNFSRLASGLGLQIPSKSSTNTDNANKKSDTAQSGLLESLTKGIVDSSLTAVKAVQVKARHVVSQNKRRYQEGGFDLDMTYITENVIAMGFPAGDLSSGLFGYFEGFYRNHMEEVIKFFETHHKGKYKVYNLCSERLYDASLFEGKVASFPFDDHNCPPIHLIESFCQSAYSWLKEDILNVVVVHCKAGKARTGLMICSLLLFLKFFPTTEECIEYYNQKRCVDAKGLILPSQIRYVKYFEKILKEYNGETPQGRRCMLRGFKLHNCPYWVRPSITISNHNGVLFSTKKHPKTKDLMPEDFWFRSARKGIVVFALPREPGLAQLVGDFKVHFHDRQGDFYCWMNTAMIQNREILDGFDFDGFDSRKLPTPGFQVELVMIDYDGTITSTDSVNENSQTASSSTSENRISSAKTSASGKTNNEDDVVFSESDGEEHVAHSKTAQHSESKIETDQISNVLFHQNESMNSQSNRASHEQNADKSSAISNWESTDIKSIAADASVFSFGDDEDYESE